VRNDTTLIDRFWSKVDKEDGEGCWVWSASRTGSGGYGQVRNEWGELEFSHRVAWRPANGPIPDGLNVCHKCDYPPCVRPGHLFLGTQLENIHDSMRKGRQVGRPRVRPRKRVVPTTTPEIRSVILSIRVTRAEYEALQRVAKRDKRPMSDLIRVGVVYLVAQDVAA